MVELRMIIFLIYFSGDIVEGVWNQSAHPLLNSEHHLGKSEHP